MPLVYDESQVEFVANPRPSIFEGRGVQAAIIARVLAVAPLMLEVVDSEPQITDARSNVTPIPFVI